MMRARGPSCKEQARLEPFINQAFQAKTGFFCFVV
jgi:hypothetical protein